MRISDYLKEYDCQWALQVFQNILSLSSMMSLRIFDLQETRNMFSSCQEDIDTLDFSALTQDPSSVWPQFENITTKLNKKFNKDGPPWRTLPSYNHPIWEEMQTSNRFNLWERVFIYRWLLGSQQQNNYENKLLSILQGKFLIGHEHLEALGEGYYLIVGPALYSDNPLLSGQNFEKNIIKPLIAALSGWLWPNKRPSEQKEQQREMALWGSLRPLWDKDTFKDKKNTIHRVLESLLRAEWPEE